MIVTLTLLGLIGFSILLLILLLSNLYDPTGDKGAELRGDSDEIGVAVKDYNGCIYYL